MKCYYNKQKLLDYDTCKALHGFKSLDYELKEVESCQDLQVDEDNIFIGGANQTIQVILNSNLKMPAHEDYPKSLSHLLRREIIKDKWQSILDGKHKNKFIKSVYSKLFTPFVNDNDFNLLEYLHISEETEVYVSDIYEFKYEYRCFVLDDKIINVSQYAGDPRPYIDLRFVDGINTEKVTGIMDIGYKDKSNEATLVECNPYFSFGSYGLQPVQYANMLKRYWEHMFQNQ